MTMISKQKFSVTFKMEATALELALYGPIGADMFGEGITDTAVNAVLKSAVTPYDSILLRLNSPGGDLFQGVSIFNLLKSQGKPVNVVVDGLAASAASLIAMVGDEIVMQPGSMLMVHEAQGFCAGYASDMAKMSETLDAVTSSAADVYVASTKLSKTRVMELLAAETWMTPKEAVKLGFATQVGNGKAVKVSNQFDLRFFKNVPEAWLDEQIADAEAEIADADEAIAVLKAELAAAEPDPLINIFRKKLELLRA
jgi:ATP-dependent Clp protease protease subunit